MAGFAASKVGGHLLGQNGRFCPDPGFRLPGRDTGIPAAFR
jgi:hypothetical protein